MLKFVCALLIVAMVAMWGAIAQERGVPDIFRNDTMIGVHACIVEHVVGIQRKEESSDVFIGRIKPSVEKFILTISRHTPRAHLCGNKDIVEMFHQECTSTFKAEMNPSITNGKVVYGRSSNIFYDDVLAGYLWITSDQRFSAANSGMGHNAYVKQGRCSRFENAAPAGPKH